LLVLNKYGVYKSYHIPTNSPQKQEKNQSTSIMKFAFTLTTALLAFATMVAASPTPQIEPEVSYSQKTLSRSKLITVHH